MIRGKVNKKLLPMIPVSVKKRDGNWMELNVLLDTGSEVGFMMAPATANDYDSLAATIGLPAELFDVKLLLGESHWSVTAKILKTDDVSGLIGPRLLLNRRITINVVENGLVEIGQIPEPSRFAGIRSLVRKRKPSLEYYCNLPWSNLKVRDSRGKWQPLTVNVDTGDNGELSLPPSLVERFGLWLPGKSRVNTTDGPTNMSCGKATICWQGNPLPVTCTQHEEEKPPLIGMELLQGKRITIDVKADDLQPVVEIA